MKRLIHIAAFCCVLPGFLCADLQSTATVDFGVEREIASQSGVLEGVNADDAKYEPIISGTEWARNFSSFTGRVQKMLDLGYRVIVRLDDFQRRNNGMMPFEDWSRWEAYVRDKARTWGTDVVYGVWNEPDLDLFWSGTEAQYHEAYRRAHAVIKDELGAEGRLSGPSVHKWAPGYIERFLDFCLENDLTVSVLQWHELDRSDNDIPSVQDNLEAARADWVNADEYASLGIEKIVLGETVGRDRTYDPGSTLGYFYYAEKGGSDGAASSCWNNDCENGSISGLLDGPNGAPRAVWWTFKAYSDGVAGRVASNASDPRVVALGSRGTEATGGVPQVLVGFFEEGSTPARADVELHLDNLADAPALQDAEAVRIRVAKLPDKGADPLAEPVETGEARFDLVGDRLTVTLPDLAREEVAVLALEPASSGFRLRVTDPRSTSFRFAWPSAPGEFFDVFFTDDLATGFPPQPLEALLPASSGETTAFTHDRADPEPRSFYTVAKVPAPVLFEEDFESGTLDSAKWTVQTTADGRARVSDEFPGSGRYALLLDDAAGGGTDSTAAAITEPFDLSGIPAPVLAFEWRDFNDEDDPEDGVFLSTDGGSGWTRVFNFNDGPSEYVEATVDLDAYAEETNVRVKFQFRDNVSIPNDGYGVDNVRVGSTAPDASGNTLPALSP